MEQMRQRDCLQLAGGLVAVFGGILVLAGVLLGDSTNIVTGAGVIVMIGASLATLSTTSGSE